MMTIKIVSDSGCDLPRHIIEKYNIKVLPLYVYCNGNEYLDGETIHTDVLYKNMRNGIMYKTAQVSPNKFKETFIECALKNEICIYIGFSSRLSGTYQSLVIAKNDVVNLYPNSEIYTIDTKCASMGLGLIVYKAAKMAREGRSKEDILKSIEFNSKHMEHIFTVDSLEYLLKGGRVTKASAFIGELLNIKPLLCVEDGMLIPKEKIRGEKRVIKRMVNLIKEKGANLKDQVVGISHGDNIEKAEKLKTMIKENVGCESFLINTIGCVIGAHTGPGTLALFFLNSQE